MVTPWEADSTLGYSGELITDSVSLSMVTSHSSDIPHSYELNVDPEPLLVVTPNESEIPTSASAIQGQNTDDNILDLSTETGPCMTSSPKRHKDATIVSSMFYEVITAEGTHESPGHNVKIM